MTAASENKDFSVRRLPDSKNPEAKAVQAERNAETSVFRSIRQNPLHAERSGTVLSNQEPSL